MKDNLRDKHHRNDERHKKPEIKIPDFDDPELLGKKAENLAKEISKDTRLSTSQLRNFYGEVKNIERLLSGRANKEETWKTLYPRIKLIKAKAVYNANRKQGKIPAAYKEFLSQCVDKIEADFSKGSESFEKFCLLFEAVVGYSSAHTKK